MTVWLYSNPQGAMLTRKVARNRIVIAIAPLTITLCLGKGSPENTAAGAAAALFMDYVHRCPKAL